ncbi:MAG: hypothetical protein IPL79_18020 [Myxococcales bacterium]|nr:hypothetical protein [Myxococcales bacterium]
MMKSIHALAALSIAFWIPAIGAVSATNRPVVKSKLTAANKPNRVSTRSSLKKLSTAKPTTATKLVAPTAAPVAKSATDVLLDQMMMLQLANMGNTMSHRFLEDVAKHGLTTTSTAKSVTLYARWQMRTFKSKKDDGSMVVMFEDNSGAYVFPDGVATPMGDISGEVSQLEEIQ